ncbi:MAG: SMP-30/gluconolactonase/LRE family protein [Lentisphaeraceae bacterium]|nr:SMP-30/gluconolactonase/LRE family protein [Lentisphaeraceae bacterium]
MKYILVSLLMICQLMVAQEQAVVTKPKNLTSEIFANGATWQQLSKGHAGCEGTQWIVEDGVPTLFYAAHHDLLAYKWTVKGGLVTWRDDNPEGTSFRPDGKGGYIVVEQMTRRLVRWGKDAKVSEVLADNFEGKKLNRPNDARIRSDQTVWFTDPAFMFNKRKQDKRELKGQYVFRYDLKNKKLTAVIKDTKTPNGIAFSPDERTLFIGDKGTIYQWTVSESGEVADKSVFFEKVPGLDGLTFDPKGRLWACGKDSIFIISKAGKKIGEIKTPGKPTSIDFSKEANMVAITTRDAAYVVKLK